MNRFLLLFIPALSISCISFAQKKKTLSSVDLSSYGIKAAARLPKGITAEISTGLGDVIIKLSDGGIMVIYNTYEKRNIAAILSEYKKFPVNDFIKIAYPVNEPDVILYKAVKRRAVMYGLDGFKNINQNIYRISQETESGFFFTESQCRNMLAVFKSLKAIK